MSSRKLYTVKEVHALLGLDGGKDCSQADLGAAIQESRCYREIGGAIRLTESDIDQFLAWCSPRKVSGGEPADHEAGQIVVIGDTIDADTLVYVAWCEFGRELSLLETVREGCSEPVSIIGYWDATYGEYRETTAAWTDKKLRWRKGSKWFLKGVRAEIREKLDEREEEA